MRESIVVIFGYASLSIFSQATTTPDPTSGSISSLINFGGVGVLAFVLWRIQSQARDDAREDRAKDRELWERHLTIALKQSEERHEAIVEAIEKLNKAIESNKCQGMPTKKTNIG